MLPLHSPPTVSAHIPQVSEVPGQLNYTLEPICKLCCESPTVPLGRAHHLLLRGPGLWSRLAPHKLLSLARGSVVCPWLPARPTLPYCFVCRRFADFCGTWNNRSWEVLALSVSPSFSLSLHSVALNHKWNFPGTEQSGLQFTARVKAGRSDLVGALTLLVPW